MPIQKWMNFKISSCSEKEILIISFRILYKILSVAQIQNSKLIITANLIPNDQNIVVNIKYQRN